MVWNKERNVQTQRNWFSRFTQGLSSSLARFGAARGSESSSVPSSSPEESRPLPGPQKTFVPRSGWPYNREVPLSVESSSEAHVKDAPRMPFPVLQMSQARSLMGQSRQRLAGHTTKIRLEASPVPETPSPMARQSISETPREILDVSSLSASSHVPDRAETDVRFPVVSPLVGKEKATPSPLLVRNDMNKMEVGTQKRSPAGRMFKGNVRIVARSPLCGSGKFDCGQRDVIVKNPAIKASSVILVTLTSNPGPVVVQYVSLLPYEGFTVHLTAPTTMHTTFNYVILPGELTL